jgi:hypothetical protein
LALNSFAMHEFYVDLQAIFDLKQFFGPIVQFKKRENQGQSVLGILDQFFKKVIDCACLQKFCHRRILCPSSIAVCMLRLPLL